MKISERLCIDLFAVSNTVQDEESESLVTAGNGNGFSRDFVEKPQKRPKMGL